MDLRETNRQLEFQRRRIERLEKAIAQLEELNGATSGHDTLKKRLGRKTTE